MRHLIDAQSLIWYVDQDHRLTTTARAAISDPTNDLLLSAATIWEIGIKVGLKKLSLSLPYRQWRSRTWVCSCSRSRWSMPTYRPACQYIIATHSTDS